MNNGKWTETLSNEELAEKLVKSYTEEYSESAYFTAPDGKEFHSYEYNGSFPYILSLCDTAMNDHCCLPDDLYKIALDYTINWLKLEHTEDTDENT